MARFLFAPIAFSGHVNPGLPIAAELVRRGHEVKWYTTRRFRGAVERVGATFVGLQDAKELDEEHLDRDFPARSGLKGLPQLKYDLHHVFLDQVPGLLMDLSREVESYSPDVIVGDSVAGVCGLVRERFGMKWAVYGVTVFTQSSRDTAPFGLGMLPNSTPLGILRNTMLNWSVEHVIFRDVMDHYRRLRRELGFSSSPLGMFEFARAADLLLQGSVPSFEYPRNDLAPNVHFIGAFPPSTPTDWVKPSWWDELDPTRKTVLVTQGTIANDYDELIRPAIRALANEPLNVIVTTGSKPPEALNIPSLPTNVRAAQFVPYAQLMPKVDLLVTNGGYGSIQIALSHGVPVSAFGASEDKAEIINRVQWSKVGIGVKSKTPSEAAIRSTVLQVLNGPEYKNRAKAMQRELAGYDAAKISGDYLESLVR